MIEWLPTADRSTCSLSVITAILKAGGLLPATPAVTVSAMPRSSPEDVIYQPGRQETVQPLGGLGPSRRAALAIELIDEFLRADAGGPPTPSSKGALRHPCKCQRRSSSAKGNGRRYAIHRSPPPVRRPRLSSGGRPTGLISSNSRRCCSSTRQAGFEALIPDKGLECSYPRHPRRQNRLPGLPGRAGPTLATWMPAVGCPLLLVMLELLRSARADPLHPRGLVMNL